MPKPSEFRRYLALAGRWLWLTVVAALVAAAGAYVLTPRMPPVYMASATLMFQPSLSWMNGYYDERTAKSLALVGQLALAAAEMDLAAGDGAGGPPTGARIQWVPDTQLIKVSAVDLDPIRAAARANTGAEAFIAWNRAYEHEHYGGYATTLQIQMEELSTKLKTLQTQIAALPAPATSPDPAKTIILEAALATYHKAYANSVALYGRTLAAMALAEDDLVITAKARVPQDSIVSSTRRVARNMILGGIVGAVLAIGVAFLSEYLDDTIKTADDVRRALGLSTLGAMGTLITVGGELIVATRPRAAAAEQCRMLRTNIRFFNVERRLRTLLVTSAIPGEGKSTILASLAVVMAQAGQRVILLDGDLRRPRLHRLFDVPLQGGLAMSLLAGSLDGNVQAVSAVAGLAVLPAGPPPPNPAELLGSRRMRELLDHLAGQADVVLIDSPPLLAVTDAALLAQLVDGVLLVVESGKTRREMALDAIARLQQVTRQPDWSGAQPGTHR